LWRYIAIVAIIALGCAIFVGLKITKTDMVATGQDYTDEQNMFDLRLLSTYGWTQEQVDAVSGLKGVSDAEGSIYLDAYADMGTGENAVFRFYSIPERINKVYLLSGRMPQAPDECLADSEYFPEEAIGSTITITANNERDTMDSLKEYTFTVVGRISSPLYMDMTRGSTSLGSGALATYIYLPMEAFDVDYYTEIYVTIPGDWTVYTEIYTDKMDEMMEQLEEDTAPLAQQRFQTLLAEAEQTYSDGVVEYENGLKEFEKGKAETLQLLEDARKELENAQAEIEENRQMILDAEKQIQEAQQQLDEGKATLEASRIELENAKAEAFNQMAAAYTDLLSNYKLVTDGLKQVNDGLTQIDLGISQIDDGLKQIEDNLPLLELMIQLSQTQVDITQAALDAAVLMGDDMLAERLGAELEEKTAQLTEYQTQLDTAKRTRLELETTRAQLISQRAELKQTMSTLNDSLDAINMGFMELETNESVAQNQFAAAQAQISAGLLELEAGQAELDAKKAELEAGKSQLLDGEQQLSDGWAEYEKGKAEAEAELSAAEAELNDAKIQLDDARKTIDEMGEPEVFALTRNTNAGYVALDSNSDIVSGIAKVLPVFFLLIAALVCITTITRMVEEERTQIGTLKAMGHSNAAIMGKYLWYSASAAIIGCAIGVLVGCTFFPTLLWNAYKIIFNIRPDVVLKMDWDLSLGITGAYLLVSSLVTWYCCRRALREVPAQLIRPKAPEAGKKVLLEYLPFWKKLSFLNKVMLRNVVRYKQRFLMMIIGIGGCTALLLTGFGLNDTIVALADMQFEEVNHYDIEVYFSEGMDVEEQKAFSQNLREQGITDHVGFFYQTSAELHFDGQARDLYLIATDEQINDYMTFRGKDGEFDTPGKNEALISIGVSEILGISIGDSITVRNSNLDSMTLTVSGIYENYLNNYVIVSPETLGEQWQMDALAQMAFLMVHEGKDVHDANRFIAELDGVMGTTVCEDTAGIFSSMMDALSLVIVVIVISAGLLGAIVLYNLTNININERIREIATIKVLGFNAAETSAYVFKENILLTVLGVIFGLPLGRWFLDFVMDHIKIDIVWFKTQASLLSYIWSVLLTLLCAALVDFIFHHKLQKINMAEALKSVE
jgi:putative ABC transport system permease protein